VHRTAVATANFDVSGLIAELTPIPFELSLVPDDDGPDLAKSVLIVPSALGASERIEPELGSATLADDMHMRRFGAVRGDDPEAIATLE
jgi:hypothetical protein